MSVTDSGTDTVSETDNSSTAFSLIESDSDSLSLSLLVLPGLIPAWPPCPGPGLGLGATATQVRYETMADFSHSQFSDLARDAADFRCRSITGVMKQGQILFFSWVSGIAHLVMMLFTCLVSASSSNFLILTHVD